MNRQKPAASDLLTLICMVLVLLTAINPSFADEPEEAIFDLSAITSAPLPDVMLSNGAATYSVPLQVSPGRNGMTPKLAITYNSYGKNTWLGVGWGLTVGAIVRTTDPLIDYNSDRFEIRGPGNSGDLVINTDLGAGYYREKIETRFSRYYNQNPNSGGWTVYHRDGTIAYYGTTTASRQSNSFGVSRWCLDKVVDPNGNAIVYDYDRIDGHLYLSEIQYVETAGGYLNRIEFVREAASRPDTTKSYATKSLTWLSRRLQRIDIHQDGDLIHRYTCTYEMGPQSGRTRLKQLDTSAWKQAGAPEETLPPIVFTYSDGGGVTFSAAVHSNIASPGDVHFADVDGDGRKDLLALDGDILRLYSAKSDGTYWFRRADFLPTTGSYSILDWKGDGQSDLLVQGAAGSTYGQGLHVFGLSCEFDYDHSEWNLVFNHLKTYQGIPAGGYQFADIDADGHQDVITTRHSNWKHSSEGDNDDTNYYVTSVTSYRYDPTNDSFTQVSSVGHSLAFKDYALSTAHYPRVEFLDINSDRRIDCMFIGGVGPSSDPGEYGIWVTYSYPVYITQADGSYPTQPMEFNFNGNHFNLGDVNGDGLTDIVTDDDHDAWAYLADGNGDFVYQGQTIDIENHYGGKGLFDINGDGLADMVQTRTSSDRIQIFTSNGDGSFARLYPMEGGIIVAREDTEKWVDVSGDGLLDIVTYAYDENDKIEVNTYLAVSDGKPDQLTGVNNGKGATVSLAYAQEDLSSSRPRPVTGTFVPFSLSPVTSRTVTDAFSAPAGQTTRYSYDGGAYDPVERDFLGFAKVTTTRPDNAQVLRSFHQDYYRKARVKQTDLMEGEDLKTRTVSTWTTSDLGNACSKVQLESRETNRYDGAETAQVVKTYTYHTECGLPLTQTTTDNSGHINGVGTVSTYINKGDWLWRQGTESISEINGALERLRHLLYDPQGNLVDDLALCRGDGCTDTDLYDYLGDKWARTQYTYDVRGNITSQTDPEGRVTAYSQYDTHDLYPARIDYPDSTDPQSSQVTAHSEQITGYDYRYGLPTEAFDRNGTRTLSAYDGFGRPVSVVTRDSASTLLSRDTYAYEDMPDIDGQRPAYAEHTITENQDGDIHQWTYLDGLGRSLQTFSQWEGGTYRTNRRFYDDMGRVVRSEGPYLAGSLDFDTSAPSDGNPHTVTQYDVLGRAEVVQSLVDSGQYASTGYVYKGFVTEITDPDGNLRKTENDALGRTALVTEVLDSETVSTEYAYTAAGDLTGVTKTTSAAGFSENEGPTVNWTMAYNTLGWKLNIEDPDMGFWEYAYAANGQLIKQTDEKGQEINFAYDELGRLSQKTYSSGAPAVTYRYDQAVNGIGRLYAVTDADGSVYRGVDAYDGLGREKTSRTQISGDSPRLTTFGYDLAGQLRTIAYPATGGYTVSYDYHAGSGLLASVSDDDGQLAAFDDYTAHGRLGGIDFINGVDTQYDYYPGAGRLDTLRTTAASGLIVDKAYTYTDAGDIETLTDGSVTYTYTYDSLHRLTGESDNTSTVPVRPMVIDLFYDDAGPLHAPSDITLNGQPRMVMYDENGNTTSLADMTDPAAVAVRTITYTDDNMPASVTHSVKGTTSFLYDGDGQRAKKNGLGGSTYYVSDLFEVIGGVETSYVFANGLRIAQVTATGKQFLHADHLGSTVAVTTEAGTKLEGKSYVPYGLTRGADDIGGTGYQFTDQELDGSTGLYNYDARLYDPVVGRFLSADSIVPNPYNPQSYNRFSYVLNNPLSFIDPSGHEPTNVKDDNGVGVSDTATLESISESYGSWDDKVGGENIASGAVARWWATNPRWRVGSTEYVGRLSYELNQLLDQGYDITGLTIDEIDGLFVGIRDHYTGFNRGAASGVLLGGAQGMVRPPKPKMKGLKTPESFFGSKTKSEVEAILSKKFGPPRGQGHSNKSYFDAANKRTYNVHQDPLHRGGKPHVDIRRRGLTTDYYKDRPFFLKE